MSQHTITSNDESRFTVVVNVLREFATERVNRATHPMLKIVDHRQ